ncbi:MAG: potassium channel family protein [Marinifilaceae bacterium]
MAATSNSIPQQESERIKTGKIVGKIMDIIVVLCSIFILVILSLQILNKASFISRNIYLDVQLGICCFFILDFFVMLYYSAHRWKYVAYRWLFLLVSIPYSNILIWTDTVVSPELNMILRAILLIRGGYGLVIMVTWFTRNVMSNLLYSYLIILATASYFGSLAFYYIEQGTNDMLHDFGDAIWWACMDVTTVGCAIEPVTTMGRVLAVILALMGMIVFPILTAFITTRFQQRVQSNNPPSQ